MHTTQSADAIMARLTALLNRPTRYEITAELSDGRRYLLAYAVRCSKMSLLSLTQRHGQWLFDQSGLAEDDPIAYSGLGGWKFGDKLRVRRSGRTQREAIMNGELDTIPTD